MKTVRHALVSPAAGTQRTLLSQHFGLRGTGQKIYIQSSLHADEIPGMLVNFYLKQRLARLERQGQLRGEIVLVPVANPIGLSQRVLGSPIGRFDLNNGVNFNRQFLDVAHQVADHVTPHLGASAAENTLRIRSAIVSVLAAQQPANEFESQQLILMRLACDADVVLDLHCDWEAILHLYTATPAWGAVESLACYLGARVALLSTDTGGSPFDEICSQIWWKLPTLTGQDYPIDANACVGVTLELRGQHEVSHALAKKDAEAILHWLMQRGVISGNPPPTPALLAEATPLAGAHPLHAPADGMIVHCTALGDTVRAGQRVVELIDPRSGRITPLYSPCDGIIFARHYLRYAVAGMSVARVAGKLATRTGPLLTP